jgi:hypothetical protein
MWPYVTLSLIKSVLVWLLLIGLVRLMDKLESKRFLLVTLGSAFLLRVLWILIIQTQPAGDGAWYHLHAISLAEGEGMVTDGRSTARLGPAWVVLLSLFYRFLGAHIFIGQAINLMLCLAIIYLAFKIAESLFDTPTAKTAAILMALWPGQIPYSGTLLSEPLFTVALLSGFYLSLKKFAANNWPGKATLVGALYGLASLARPIALTYLPVNVLVMLLRGQSLKKTAEVTALALLGLLVVMTPWVYRNYKAFQAFVPTTTHSGIVLWQGNNPDATGIPSDGAFQPHDDVKDEVLRDSLARQEAVAFIKEDPKRFARMFFARLYRMYEVDIEVAQSSLQAGRPLPTALSVGYLKICNTFFNAMMPLFCVFMLLPLFRIRGFSLPSWLIVMLPVAYFALLQAVFLAQDRYKYPTLSFVAIGVALVLNKMRTLTKALWDHSRFGKVSGSELKIEQAAL